MRLNAIGLLFGVAFGYVLGWARLTDYDVIRNMLLLREPDVFLITMSAIVTASVGVRVLRAYAAKTVLDGSPVSWRVEAPRRDHVIGSVFFGLGWSFAATCPGPVAAQLGRGQFAALFTIAGLATGILVCDRVRLRATRAGRTEPLRDTASVVGL